MYERTFAPEKGSDTSSAEEPSVSDNMVALRADISGLAESVQRLVAESPELARESFEASIRRNPIQATFIAAGIGFLLSLIIAR